MLMNGARYYPPYRFIASTVRYHLESISLGIPLFFSGTDMDN